MRNKQPDNNDNGVKAKVPTIRLKLKVSSKEEPEKGKEEDKASEDVNVNAHLNVNVNETANTVVSPVSQVSQVSSSAPSSSSSHSSTRLICGTFKYRPFKLFPLLPPSSRYRVLVPPPYTDITRNPAVRLNYLWSSSSSLPSCYTDDSDLVCVAVRDGWCKADDIKGKELLIEVEVIDINNLNDIDPVSPHTHVSTVITPRIYPAPHDGNHIRILSVTIDPAAVHLKRWRKHKRRRSDRVQPQLLTPKFKTQSVNV